MVTNGLRSEYYREQPQIRRTHKNFEIKAFLKREQG